MLQQECIGRIGCHAGGVTYVVPVTYWYDGSGVICHSREGLKIRMMRENPNVCFEVDRMKDMTNWESVIAQGSFVELSPEDAVRAMQLFSRWLKPRMPSVTADPAHPENPHGSPGAKAVAFRIELAEKSGRFEKR